MTGFLFCWYLLTALSLLFVIYDQLTNTPSMRVMTLAWVLILLYTGPLGLFIYLLSCRQPMPNTHDEFIKAHWKQAVGSVIHCVAGDATAIILSAIVLSFFSISNGVELVIEYVAAYLFGLLIFQALFMRSMFSSYREAVMKTLFVETVSMNFVMTGMLPVIVLVKHFIPTASDPAHLEFWGMMSLATIVGFIVAYPVNSWLVNRGIKHGMMSRPQKEMGHEHHMMMHEMQPLSMGTKVAWALGTYALMIAALAIISIFAPIVWAV